MANSSSSPPSENPFNQSRKSCVGRKTTMLFAISGMDNSNPSNPQTQVPNSSCMLQGLGQLRDKAKQLAKADATVLVQRFGELGKRKFNLAA
jgi:hypothetical protein